MNHPRSFQSQRDNLGIEIFRPKWSVMSASSLGQSIPALNPDQSILASISSSHVGFKSRSVHVDFSLDQSCRLQVLAISTSPCQLQSRLQVSASPTDKFQPVHADFNLNQSFQLQVLTSPTDKFRSAYVGFKSQPVHADFSLGQSCQLQVSASLANKFRLVHADFSLDQSFLLKSPIVMSASSSGQSMPTFLVLANHASFKSWSVYANFSLGQSCQLQVSASPCRL
ncbi:hypothetical protein B296_00021908 [Ensete ventricosum]|uniref:Uncharacterized protein n=1 Tax=Ensete ventricosum TaxID=4639 RepID=A0A427AQ42_ENSVE|nr:hypothetical protein B296_00021908 [Ensete ventricosum]